MEVQNNENGPKEVKQPEGDLIQTITGSFGKYQLGLCLLLFIIKIFVALHQMAIIFLAPKIKYTCKDTGTETCPCANPIYDTSVFTMSIIMKWNLICDRRFLASLSQTLFQLGVLLGSVFFGIASDRFGRKLPLLVAVVVQILGGIIAAYLPDYWSFTFARFLVGASVGGTMVISFVIIMEFVGKQYRDVIAAVYQIPFNLGHMLLPLLGYLFRDYSHFQLSVSVPATIMLIYFVLVPETPRWLIAVNKSEKAIPILERVAKVNKRPTDNIKSLIDAYQATLHKSQLKKGSVVDLFRTPNIRKNILAMSFNWLTCSYCFYGVSQYVGQLSGNVFFNVLSGACLTLLGTLASIPLLRLIGRRTIVIVFNLLCSACLFLLAMLPNNKIAVACASVGQVSSFIVFVVVYLYCSELFPTVVRNAAVGVCSMSARVGSMIAPFVIDLRPVASWLPPLAFAILPLISGFLTFILPETKGCELMTTIEEGEQFGKKERNRNADQVTIK